MEKVQMTIQQRHVLNVLVNAKKVMLKKIGKLLEDDQSETIENYSRWLSLNFGNGLKDLDRILLEYRIEKQPLNEMECNTLFNNKITVDCTGNVCEGDVINFEQAVFTGNYPKARFSHMESIYALVLKDSYGEKKQQHTFTILKLNTFDTTHVKGRNIYRNGTIRLLWNDEYQRDCVLEEKYERGTKNRIERAKRKLNEWDPTTRY